MIYLASPYRHKDPNVVKRRVMLTALAQARFAFRGVMIYSPVLHGHCIDQLVRRRGLAPTDRYWLDHGLRMLELCEKVFVLMLSGWEDSAGIKDEVRLAHQLGIPVLYLNQKLEFAEPPCQFHPVDLPMQG